MEWLETCEPAPQWPRDGLGDAVHAEDLDRALRHLFEVLDEHGAPRLQVLDDVPVVDDFVEHVYGRSVDTFPLQEIAEAHQFMESNQQIGKIVVTTG